MAEGHREVRDKAKGVTAREAVVIGFLLVAIMALLLAIHATLRPWLEARELQQRRSGQLQELDRNWVKWQNQHVLHYRMTVSYAGYGSSGLSVTVEVKNNEVMPEIETQRMVWSSGNRPMTVPALFSFAQGRIEDAAYMYVNYDSALGYPVTIYVDPWREPCCQDYTYSIEALIVLP